MDVKYEVPGKEGKQCKDCKNFEPEKNSNAGQCMGYPVEANAGCNLFAVKNDKD